MKNYKIEYKIKTLLDITLFAKGDIQYSFHFNSIKYEQWEYSKEEGPTGQAWIASGEINAENSCNAIKQFEKKLSEALPYFSIVGQAFISFSYQPCFVRGINNSKFLFYYPYTDPVCLPITNDELRDLNILYDKEISFESLLYIHESTNTFGYPGRLMLLLAGLESLVGKVEKSCRCCKNKKCSPYTTYDRDKIKDILGNDDYNKIYGNNGIRHKLAHGSLSSFCFDKNYLEDLYRKIIVYINTQYSVNISNEIIKPQRHFTDRKAFMDIFKPQSENFNLSLKEIISKFKIQNRSIEGCDIIKNEKDRLF